MEDNLPYLITVAATLTAVIVSVLIHYEGLRLLSRWVTLDLLPERIRIVSLIFGQLILHVVGIALFAMANHALSQQPGFGSFLEIGAENCMTQQTMNAVDFLYYSAVVYTTLGFGDIVAYGPVRILAGMEALVGLVLITWSASFTFLKMQIYWGRG
jgi:uncharacterized membrane protein